MQNKTYSNPEEIANSITHGIGTALGIAGLSLLVVMAAKQNDVWKIVSFSIYGSTLIILYLASTLYHSFRNEKIKSMLKIIDHASIYILIAGTYTPFMLINLRGPWGWSIFGSIWGMAILGIFFKVFFIGKAKKLSLIVYVFMGWLCMIALKEMLIKIPTGGMIWLAVGGLFYTLGIIFYIWRKLPYNHAVWHLFVLAGSISHYFSVFFYILPEA
ncbi:MAG: hemolysin III family protein [Calditrichaceae bacterium]|nr:hemolysin III family protein [Calditrichaceae bacterium]